MKLLVIEDDREAAAYLAKGLTESGYVVDQGGTKTVFLNDAIGRVIYFDPIYYEELDHERLAE